MRFLLFHGSIESLNHFTDELEVQLRDKGHQAFVVDLCGNYLELLTSQLIGGIDAIITYDCIGTAYKEIYDELHIPVVNILMDHPMNLAYCMRNPPQMYIQLSPDERHVDYARRFFGIENAAFVPHMASLSTDIQKIPYEKKDIPLLFPGGITPYNALYEQIKEKWSSGNSRILALGVIERLLARPWETVEDALEGSLAEMGMELGDPAIASFLEYSKEIDLFIRMYWRSEVIARIVNAHIPITLIGGGNALNKGVKAISYE